ncbi:MAG TPA: hemolysin family protein, partial [Actinotalea sp.]|nr:hemolysin family protein [Actinotalea sp.]
LVPKRLALQRTARVALIAAPPLDRFATVMRPIIWMLSASTNAVVRLLGGDPSARSELMTEQELRDLVIAHESLADDERRILHDVFDAGDRTLAEVMRPRGDVAFVPAALDLDQARAMISRLPYSRYPVTGRDFDDIIGFVHVRDLLDASTPGTLADITREILILPATNHVLPTLSVMRRQGIHIAIVVDEYGGTDGIVTLEDLVEELVGDIRDEHDTPRPPATRDVHGSLRLDAGMTLEEFADHVHVDLAEGPYETVAGYVLSRLGRLGRVGDTVRADDLTLTVSVVAGRRIVAIDVTPSPDADLAPGHGRGGAETT